MSLPSTWIPSMGSTVPDPTSMYVPVQPSYTNMPQHPMNPWAPPPPSYMNSSEQANGLPPGWYGQPGSYGPGPGQFGPQGLYVPPTSFGPTPTPDPMSNYVPVQPWTPPPSPYMNLSNQSWGPPGSQVPPWVDPYAPPPGSFIHPEMFNPYFNGSGYNTPYMNDTQIDPEKASIGQLYWDGETIDPSKLSEEASTNQTSNQPAKNEFWKSSSPWKNSSTIRGSLLEYCESVKESLLFSRNFDKQEYINLAKKINENCSNRSELLTNIVGRYLILHKDSNIQTNESKDDTERILEGHLGELRDNFNENDRLNKSKDVNRLDESHTVDDVINLYELMIHLQKDTTDSIYWKDARDLTEKFGTQVRLDVDKYEVKSLWEQYLEKYSGNGTDKIMLNEPPPDTQQNSQINASGQTSSNNSSQGENQEYYNPFLFGNGFGQFNQSFPGSQYSTPFPGSQYSMPFPGSQYGMSNPVPYPSTYSY